MRLDRKTLTADAMDNNLVSMGNDGTVEKDVEYIEKTYFKHVDKNLIGVIVGYRDVIVKGCLDAEYQEECDVGVGVIPEAQRLFQMAGIGRTWRGEWSGFVNGSSGWRDLKIIAWQPLPEPYREEQENNGEENE